MTDFEQFVNDEEPTETPVFLVTISHKDLPVPLRLCTSHTPIVSRGAEFIPYPSMGVAFPDDEEERSPAVRIRLEDVDRTIVYAVRSLPSTDAVTFLIELILASLPDVVQAPAIEADLFEANYDSATIDADLRVDDIFNIGGPALAYTPAVAPALFATTK